MNANTIYTLPPIALPDTIASCDTAAFSNDSYLLVCNDSVFAPFQDIAVRHIPSLVTPIVPSVHEPHATSHPTPYSSSWIFGTIVLLLILISIYINSRKFRLKDILISLFDMRSLDRVVRENNIKNVNLLPMSLIYLASLGLLSLKIPEVNLLVSTKSHIPLLFLSISLVLILILFVKNGIITLIGNIFNNMEACHLYITNNYLFNLVTALITVPLLLPVFFGRDSSEVFFYIELGIISITFIIKLFRGFQLIFRSSNSSNLYIFFYLCILELAPILIVGKILIL